MHVIFEDAGKLLAGRLLSATDTSAQVELETGRRLKVKAAHILLRFETPTAQTLMAQAQILAAEVELDLAWEFAPEGEFGFAELAQDYFSASASPVEQAAMLLALFGAPHYFRRAGRGCFRKASADVLRQALAAIEKKKQVQAQIDGWAAELADGHCPEEVRNQLYKILFRPDKNSAPYKAVVEAARRTQRSPLDLLLAASAIESPYQFHWQRFLLEHFPSGTQFAPCTAPQPPQDLPLAQVRAYSIDDSFTTEIDDALSVTGLGTGAVTVGIHIAAPGLAIVPGSEVDRMGRARLSTVYMPGYKITMLPDEVVRLYTLDEGRANPAVSLYVRYDETTLAVLEKTTRLERVPVSDNFRHDRLEHIVTEAWLHDPATPTPEDAPAALVAVRDELAFLHRLAQHLKAGREAVRGKPETFTRPDYSFRLEGNNGAVPQGSETVHITPRHRGAPLDLIVAEAAIVANTTWGQMLAEAGVPGIYRSQASMAPGIKVRMSTKALPHAGMGVPCYAWATSPLRRYVDLVNQWQLIACVRGGPTAALTAPFKPRDAELFAIIGSFEAAYSAYNAHQSAMERFWTLQYLRQQGITEIDGDVIRDNAGSALLVRAHNLPLVVEVPGAQGCTRGARVRLRLGETNLLTLEVHATLLARLDDPADPGDDATLEDDDDLAAATAQPITIAVDVNGDDPDAPGTGAAPVLQESSAP